MSEISEIKIKSMTKEQNYMRGYEDGKSDVVDEIKAEIDAQYKWLMQTNHTLYDIDVAFDVIRHCINKHIGRYDD